MKNLFVLAALLFSVQQPCFAIELRQQADAPYKPAMSVPLLPAPRYAASVDLGYQFTGQRDQNKIGSCHDFSAVALVEAAYFRYYGKHIDLAEQDLFSQTKLCSGEACNKASVYTANDGSRQCNLAEGGSPSQDLNYILTHGVLPDEAYACHSYDQFASSYVPIFQDRLEKAIVKLDAKGKTLPKVQPGKLDKMVDRYVCPAENADELRRKVKNELKGFKADGEMFFGAAFIPADAFMTMKPEECRADSSEQKKFLLNMLNQNIPVSVGVHLIGMKAWGYDKPRPTGKPGATYGHAFLIIGYEFKDGQLVFKTRNSWIK
ncbi:MAG TPA: C1 family peptidase, partial [Elusimicrobiales bacterium]|nr:C1 family peptidase [Elusimicrobiales bacterium]